MKLKINKNIQKFNKSILRYSSTSETPNMQPKVLVPNVQPSTIVPNTAINKENELTKDFTSIPRLNSNYELNKSIIKKNDNNNSYSVFGFFACVVAGAAAFAYYDYKDRFPNDELRDTIQSQLGSVIDFDVLKYAGQGNGTHGRHAPRLYKLNEEKGIYIYVKKLNGKALINELWMNRLAYELGIGTKSYLVKVDHGNGKSAYYVATKSIGSNTDMQAFASEAKESLQMRESFNPKNFMASLVFSYLIGDKDNKLKNYIFATYPNGVQIVYSIDQELANPKQGSSFKFTTNVEEFLFRGGLGEYDKNAKVQDDGGQLGNITDGDRSDEYGMGMATYGKEIHEMIVNSLQKDIPSAIVMLKQVVNMSDDSFKERVIAPFGDFFTYAEKQDILSDFKKVQITAANCLEQYELNNDTSINLSFRN
ncbi:MAG: hypothetical protein HYX60_04765 [Legionella longbeachae]|nr:hypothetical protein [Legionella longbeachae]